VPPGEFIPLAERSGLMGPLGDWVLEEGCRQLAVWAQDPRAADLVLAINISAVQIERPDFVEQVLVCVERAGVDPSKLKLELTESVLARDLNDVADKLRRLKERGIGCSLDDFGTGYSSLRYLQRLPLDQLKIDRSFVGNLLNTPSDAAIARTMIELGRSLNLQVIAEGVETDEQRRALLSMGCSRYQGFLFARPLDADQFLAFVHDAPASGVGTALVSKQAACGPCGPAIGPGLSVAATAEA
jgi:EAL domain-containing protein (putative c-di-GMP-specific phosphodiesterase class I)